MLTRGALPNGRRRTARQRIPMVRIVDANPADALDRAAFGDMRDKLHNALLKLELREQDLARLEARNAYLEGELRLQGQHHTNTLKEIVTLKQALARQGAGKPPGNRPNRRRRQV